MGKMTVYHGSYTTVKIPKVIKGKNTKDGIITRDQFWSLARFKYPTHQINFCSPESLKCLEFVSGEEVTG